MATVEVDLAMHPYQVAKDTYVIPWILEAPPIGYFPMNSMVIRGKEPVIVDTGSPADREQWLANVAAVVDPADVKWIFLSHDDRDHAGNLLAALDACPNATLLTSWFSIGRMAEEWMTPMDRVRFVNDGDTIDVGDRKLVAMRPPVFDNPTTRGLFDQKTGVYWAVDTFATNVPRPMEDAGDLTMAEFQDGQLLGSRIVAPWHEMLDDSKFQAKVDQIRAMDIKVLAACHTPAIYGSKVDEAFALLRTLPGADPWMPYTQADLEMWMSAGPPPA